MHHDARPWLQAAAAAAVISCAERTTPSESFGLDCVFDSRSSVTECAHVRAGQSEQALTLSESRELAIDAVEVTRSVSRLTVDVHLAGRFWNETDQNLYVFVGGPTADGVSTSYAISADAMFASDLGYPARSALRLPHTPDVRVGVMAPTERQYTPQVYVNDPVHAEAVGASAGVTLRTQEGVVHVEIPLERYYAVKKAPIPEHLSVTVATARDYVGFIDQISVRDLSPGGTKKETSRVLPPVAYPMLDARSHHFERVALRTAGRGVSVEFETSTPIVDWAQTNLHFFFLPAPPYLVTPPLHDPSRTRTLPYKWSFYCGVYSPHRLFCKASRGKDFTFDTAYAERDSLAAPAGVMFREVAPGRYALDLAAEHLDTLRAGRATFALVVAAGRDGFGPTSWYGVGAAPAR